MPRSSPETTPADLSARLSGLPSGPGVYIMKNSEGSVIYVGKAANIKHRIASYFSNTDRMDAKTRVLVRHIAYFETVLTATENEALILESNLIKRHRPRYNVILKDDKRYPSLRIDVTQAYPNLTVVRKIRKDGALYFGPYSSPGAVRETLKLLNRNFRLRKCKSHTLRPRRRPCLNYQIDACLAPCCHAVDPNLYSEMVAEIKMFLSGRTGELLQKVKKDMQAAAARQDYELAAVLRDKMHAIQQTIEKQSIVTNDFIDRDVVGLSRSADYAVIMLLKVRQGHLSGMKSYTLRDPLSSDDELICAFIRHHYETAELIPREIVAPVVIEDALLFNAWLSGIKKRKVEIIRPARGLRARLLAMAAENAAERLKMTTDAAESAASVLAGLQKLLGLASFPRRIECIDNSGLGGKDMVSGIVVYEDGAPKKPDYRKYRLDNIDLQDDYAAMAQVLERRFSDVREAESLPDLLLVDGGKGQLNIAAAVLKEKGFDGRVPVIAIAKNEDHKDKKEPCDRVFIPGRTNPVNFAKQPRLLMFLMEIRDEAHRFCIGFHRRKRNKRAMESALDAVFGIGEKRKKTLLKHFETIDGIRRADPETLAGLPGMNRKAAESIIDALGAENNRAAD